MPGLHQNYFGDSWDFCLIEGVVASVIFRELKGNHFGNTAPYPLNCGGRETNFRPHIFARAEHRQNQRFKTLFKQAMTLSLCHFILKKEPLSLNDINPILEEYIQKPLAFAGGFVAGLLKVNLTEDPIKSWLENTISTPGTSPPSSSHPPNGNGPQTIDID